MTRVKVLGAGSIGNHLSNAARKLGWRVTIVDVDPAALVRTKESLYSFAATKKPPEAAQR